jgi:hypothetical protein
MVHPSIIEARLGELRFRSSRWFRAEVHELQHVLMDHEKIIALACGRYFGSYALLVATDHRLLLIDKRVFFMNMESTPYDMISEIDFNSQAYNATLTIFTLNKTHKFTSIKYKSQLRDISNYAQKRIAEMRNQQQAVPMPNSVLSQLPPALRREGSLSYMSQVQPAAPPIGTSYNYSPVTTDDTVPAFTEHSPGVAQMVGSAAMNGTHRRPYRPFNPYVQGSLMTRRPISTPRTEYEIP